MAKPSLDEKPGHADPAPGPRINGIVLQGGGALGAFELGALECLLDQGIQAKVVSGVSIGAINATVLCGHRDPDPRVSLRALWQDLTVPGFPFVPDQLNANLSVFGNPGMYRTRFDFFALPHWTSYYDTSPLLVTLHKHVDFARLRPQGDAPRLLLTATNIETGQLETFDSAVMPITPEHVLASGSLPPGFPPTRAAAPPENGSDSHCYWDGGLFDNTPLSPVIDALQAALDCPDKWLWVVNLFPGIAPLPANLKEVNDRMVALLFGNKMGRELRRANKVTKLIAFLEAFEQVLDRLDPQDEKLRQLVRADNRARAASAQTQALDIDALLGLYQELRALRDSEGYQAIKQYGARINIVEITNTDFVGGSDFSAASLRQRRDLGYKTAAKSLAENHTRLDPPVAA